MKVCPFCGKEYSDDTERCIIDDHILMGDVPPPLPVSDPLPPRAAYRPIFPLPSLTERQMLVFELVLVLGLAFSGGILSSIYSNRISPITDRLPVTTDLDASAFRWGKQCIRQIFSLGLLVFVLARRGKTLADLGLVWWRRCIGWSVLLFFGQWMCFGFTFEFLKWIGLAPKSSSHVADYLFGQGITFPMIADQFINPFFEELLVRAYLMTVVKVLTNNSAAAILISVGVQISYHFYQGTSAGVAHLFGFLVFAIYYSRTGKITPVILAHLYADVASFGLYWWHHK